MVMASTPCWWGENAIARVQLWPGAMGAVQVEPDCAQASGSEPWNVVRKYVSGTSEVLVTVTVPFDVEPSVVTGKVEGVSVNVGFTPLPLRLVCAPTVTRTPCEFTYETRTTSAALCVTSAAGA